MSDAPFDEAIQQLLNASGPEEARRLLRASPWLASQETDRRLTVTIADMRRQHRLQRIASLTACRGLLRRIRSGCRIKAALGTQPGWPLRTQGPMAQLLAMKGDAPPDLRIACANAALDDVDPEHEPDLYGLIRYHLGLGYQARADAGSVEGLDLALEQYQAAEQAWRQESPLLDSGFRGRAQANLGRLYLQRRHANRSQDIETALRWFAEAHDTFGPEAAELLTVFILTGDAFLSRIQEERLQNIEEGIHFYEEAYKLAQSVENLERLGDIEHNLAVAYRLRLDGRPAKNYEQAKKKADRALARFDRRRFPEQWARTTGELATIYGLLQSGNRAANLEQAIVYARQALEIYRPSTHPREWALTQLTLGNLYCDRLSGSRARNDRRAMRCFRAICEQVSPATDPLRWAEAMNNLGTIYASHSTRSLDPDYHQAIQCFRQVLEVCDPQALPAKALQTAINWGNLDFRFGNWEEAWTTFETALQAGQALYEASSTEAGRRVELAETSRLYARAAYCLLQMGQPDKALLQMEQGKARLLADALALGDSDLAILPGPQRQDVLDARRVVRELEAQMRLLPDVSGLRSGRDLAKNLGRARGDLNRLIETIRAEHSRFMSTGLDLCGILKQIPQGGALVAPLVTSQGGAVFALPHGTTTVDAGHVIPLDPLTDDLLIGSQDDPGWIRAYRAYTSRRGDDALPDWQAAIELLTGRLWTALMGPAHARLASLGLADGAPVTLMPQGGLGLLPLHAAWRWVDGMRRFFVDDYTVSYAPSAYVLSVSRQRLQDQRRHQPNLLAIINPTRNLPYAPIEGDAVSDLFPPAARLALIQDQATAEALVQESPGRTYLHFACHGSYAWEDVMQSALILANQYRFTLSEILSRLDLSSTRLVTLSACETGLTEFQRSPDEYVGLPAGFLQAGAPEVVSTLWRVDDLSTALLMARFYQEHLEKGRCPSQALRAAQRWLRTEVDRHVVIEHIERMLQALDARCARVPRYSEERETIDDRMKDLQGERANWLQAEKRDPGGRPFDHPYYWAAFTVSGSSDGANPIHGGE